MRKEGFERDRYWWRSWEREAGAPSVKKKKKERKREKWGFDCVWLRLDFYFKKAYVASPDWRV